MTNQETPAPARTASAKKLYSAPAVANLGSAVQKTLGEIDGNVTEVFTPVNAAGTNTWA